MTVYQEPAFPSNETNEGHFNPGMTLRDYFAAKAVQGMCAHPDTWGMGTDGLALQAYQLADAMIKAREAK